MRLYGTYHHNHKDFCVYEFVSSGDLKTFLCEHQNKLSVTHLIQLYVTEVTFVVLL